MAKEVAPNTVVIDTGSWSTKCGLAGADEPSDIIPTLVGEDTQKASARVGKAARESFNTLDAQCPLVDGYPYNWGDLEKLWSHVFTDALSVDPTTCNVLLTDSTTNSRSNREKMTVLMFEKFKVNGLYIAMQSVLGMYSVGRLTGLVIDSGHVDTHVVPVYEGFCISDAIERIPIGGKDISDYLVMALRAKGINSSARSFSVFEAAKIKEATCRVAENFDSEIKAPKNQEYTLPDGTKVVIGKESLEAAEMLFRPQIAEPTTEQPALPRVIQQSIGKCETDVRGGLKAAITLIGGTSMTAGYPERVSKEATALLEGRTKVISHPGRENYSWIGGSILASLSPTDWITKQDYAEQGVGALRKCPGKE